MLQGTMEVRSGPLLFCPFAVGYVGRADYTSVVFRLHRCTWTMGNTSLQGKHNTLYFFCKWLPKTHKSKEPKFLGRFFWLALIVFRGVPAVQTIGATKHSIFRVCGGLPPFLLQKRTTTPEENPLGLCLPTLKRKHP